MKDFLSYYLKPMTVAASLFALALVIVGVLLPFGEGKYLCIGFGSFVYLLIVALSYLKVKGVIR